MFIYILFDFFCSHYCTTVSYTLRELFGQPQLSLKKYLYLKKKGCLCVHTCDCMIIILLDLQWWLGGLAAKVGQSRNTQKTQSSYV